MRRTLATALTLALPLAFGLAAAAGAADWRTNQDAYESGLFLDVSSYKVLPDGHRRIWVLQSFPKPLDTRAGPIDFQVDLFELDCPQRTLAVRYAVVSYMDGRSDSNAQASAPAPIASGTKADRIWDVVCGDMSRLTSVPGEASVIAHRYRALAKVLFQ